MSRVVPFALGVTSVASLAYWRHLSPYSQALGAFPQEAPRPAARPSVALTFDDGPNEPFTSQIAEVLAARGIPGTFFQVGLCVRRHPEATRDLAAAGHTIGNHSYSHRWQRGWRVADLREEIQRAEDTLSDELGRRPLLYRPPWLLRTSALFQVLSERGLQPVSGEFCHPLEPFQPSGGRIAARAERRARPGRILIFHDGYDARGGNREQTVGAVERLADRLLERGYEFTTVDRLLEVPAYA